jgi:putative transposase
VDMHVLSYCIMPTHWHMVLLPQQNRDLSRFMSWLTTTHASRWHASRRSKGTGHLYQGRFKSFPVQSDAHFFTVCRYVERNPLRASLVTRAEDWPWGSLWRRTHDDAESVAMLAEWPVPMPAQWVERVNEPLTQTELDAMRQCIVRGRPFGSDSWTHQTADQLGLQSTLRSRGRPKGPKGV